MPGRLLGAALILALAGCGQGEQEYAPPEGGFAVVLPGTPTAVTDPELPEGAHMVRVALRSGACAVAWQDLGPGGEKDPEERLDRACNGALRALGARQVSRKP